MEQTKKYTVITGASSGIGYETAKAFAARGKNPVIVARRKENLERLKDEIQEAFPSVDVVVRVSDLSVPENAHRLYAELKNFHLETWINNAGFGNYDGVAEQNLEKIEKMLRLNVEAPTILSTLFVRDYKDVPGTQLINVSSCGGYAVVPPAVTYCATKFYVSAFTEGLARELIESGAKMRAKVFAPAATATEFGKRANDTGQSVQNLPQKPSGGGILTEALRQRPHARTGEPRNFQIRSAPADVSVFEQFRAQSETRKVNSERRARRSRGLFKKKRSRRKKFRGNASGNEGERQYARSFVVS